ncbi:pyrimidine utilization transport protein G [Yersinia aleksiciae]|uniref:pyrimidine utilization transport protein G n=1 Tax=Yersinia aleksiciae TaxID=263819 RepID=UPI00119D9064|nr:pyrimidine utilization transport protein G [Yersinia aleksiciae]
MSNNWFPIWRKRSGNLDGAIIAPDERLPIGATLIMGLQHAVAMFGATVLMPLLMGFDANLAILMSGIGTLLFFLIVGGRVPSYLGSSAAFVGLVIAVTGYTGSGPNPNIALALGGIIACGALYTLIGFIVMSVGTRWIERLMPPVVTGAVVMAIGLNLAPIAVNSVSGSSFNSWMAVVTILCIGVVAVFTSGMVQRLLILVGLILSYVIYLVVTNGFGWGTPVDFGPISQAAWFGWPQFTTPVFDAHAMLLIAPVAVILVAENLGHIKAVAGMTGKNLDPYMGRAFVGDGLATMLSGSVGGTGVTTYAENIGVMAVTKIYSTLVFVAAALVAILLGFSPKFGALIHTIPGPVLGGASIVVFGLIAVAGARIWLQNSVDLSDNGNLIMVAVTLVLGAGNFALTLGNFTLGGIGTATFGAILLNALLQRRKALPGLGSDGKPLPQDS